MTWLLVLVALAQTSRPAESKAALAMLSKVADPQRRATMTATDFADRGIAPKLVDIFKPLALTAPNCAEFVATGLEEGAEDAVKKRCGKTVAELKASKPDAMLKSCKLKAPDKKRSFDRWSVLLSAITADQLDADAAATADEKSLAKFLAWSCDAEK